MPNVAPKAIGKIDHHPDMTIKETTATSKTAIMNDTTLAATYFPPMTFWCWIPLRNTAQKLMKNCIHRII
jgi:hypothetical protein